MISFHMKPTIITFLIVAACLLVVVVYFSAKFVAPAASISRPVHRVPASDPGLKESMQPEPAKAQGCRPYGETLFQGYAIRLYDGSNCPPPPPGHSRIEILKAGKSVYALASNSFALGYPLDQDQPPDSVKPAVGMDFTGEGPGLLVSEWSGGAHCCYTFHIFQLGAAFQALPAIPLQDADESAFVRRPGIKGLVLSTVDYSAFAYFPKDFAGSPAGHMFLSFDGKHFSPNLALMKSNAPVPGETAKCAARFKQSHDWKQSQAMGMWYYATDLLYTGNAVQVWRFLDQAWGGKPGDKQQYVDEYRARLMKSVYYRDLEQLQNAPVTAASQKIDWTRHCFDYVHG